MKPKICKTCNWYLGGDTIRESIGDGISRIVPDGRGPCLLEAAKGIRGEKQYCDSCKHYMERTKG